MKYRLLALAAFAMVWRASSSETLAGDPENNEKKLEHEVADMFKHFPPEHK